MNERMELALLARIENPNPGSSIRCYVAGPAYWRMSDAVVLSLWRVPWKLLHRPRKGIHLFPSVQSALRWLRAAGAERLQP